MQPKIKLMPAGRRKVLTVFIILLFFTTLPGCALVDNTMNYLGLSNGKSIPDTPDSLAFKALGDYNHGDYSKALKAFNDIMDRFPFSKAGLLAELKSADCQYYLGKYPEAISQYNDFANNHPTNEAIPYVIFQVGMSYYKQIDTIDRDPGAAKNAVDNFARLIKSYPHSAYIQEARARRLAALNFLANHEFYVANFYVRTNHLREAKGRYLYLIKHYPESSVSAKARKILADIAAGHPPRRTWRDWLPDLSLPDWHTFSNLNPGGGTD